MVDSPYATGGIITKVGNEYIHTFLSSADFVLKGRNIHTVEVLVVAGGGGANGNRAGGGGGAGGLLYDANHSVSQQTYSVVVGAGGEKSNTDTSTQGGNSTFSTIEAIGGGWSRGTSEGTPGGNGGSGGGSSGGDSYGDVTPGTGIAGQGNNGGIAIQSSTAANQAGGGGGGAGAVGSNAANGVGGNGGDGVDTYSDLLIAADAGEDIAGVHWIAGGGGGGTRGATQGTGGNGGGGDGVKGAGEDGLANTGGGGGGGAYTTSIQYGGTGGSGIVIIRYKKPRGATPQFM